MLDKLLDGNVDCKLVKLLSFWFSGQVYCVRWRYSLSSYFSITSGTRQERVTQSVTFVTLPVFSQYTRELLGVICESGIGCKWTGQYVNVFAYADKIVLIAPSWKGSQKVIYVLHVHSSII